MKTGPFINGSLFKRMFLITSFSLLPTHSLAAPAASKAAGAFVSGVLTPEFQVDIKASQRAILREIKVSEGDEVKEGQVLGELRHAKCYRRKYFEEQGLGIPGLASEGPYDG